MFTGEAKRRNRAASGPLFVGAPPRVAGSRSLGMWILLIVAVLIVAQFAWAELREWAARRRAVRRGRTLTAKYGIPWR